MSCFIVIHKRYKEDIIDASNYLYEMLNNLYPGDVHKHYNGSLINIENRISIVFRCGSDPYKFGGLLINYYYTDDNNIIANILEQGAAKHNGKRLKNLDQVIKIINFHMNMFDEINGYLGEKKGE